MKFDRSMFHSVGVKLFILIFCAMLICVLALGWFSYSRSKRAIEQEVAEASRVTARQTAETPASRPRAPGTRAKASWSWRTRSAGSRSSPGNRSGSPARSSARSGAGSETVGALNEADPVFREQIDSVREAHRLFRKVRMNMNAFVGRLEDATASIRRLEQVQTAMAEAMADVSSIAQQAAAAPGEVANLSRDQLGVSEHLVELANRLESVSDRLKISLSRFTVV